MTEAAAFWDALDPKYRLILCDVWGVVHNGVRLLPGAAGRLKQWRDEGRTVVLLTNAPRTAEAVEEQLRNMGLRRDAYDRIVTSGEAGIGTLNALGEPVGFIGTAEDRAILEGRGVRIASGDQFSALACTGTEEARPYAEQYREDLLRWASLGVRMHCLNPDRHVMHGGVPEVCAGAIADLYEQLGGAVTWYGKPYPAIYAHALRLAGDPPKEQVLAVGDGLQTDMLGAARMGFDALFVSGGVHRGAPFPERFAPQSGLGDWAPIATVDGLA